MDPETRLVFAGELARELGWSRHRVMWYAANRRIPFTRLGPRGKRLFDIAEVRAHLERRTVPPNDDDRS